MKIIVLTLVILFGLSGCLSPEDKPEIKQCSDAGGIPVRSVWDNSLLADCIFKQPTK